MHFPFEIIIWDTKVVESLFQERFGVYYSARSGGMPGLDAVLPSPATPTGSPATLTREEN
jgi:hypothetical protein